MARMALISNGVIAALYDHNFHIRDLYYPLLDQHHNHSVRGSFRYGLWKDGNMVWLDSVDKAIEMNNLLVTARFNLADASVTFSAAASQTRPAIITKVQIRGEGLFRVIQYNDFRLNNSELGDTAFYDPGLDAIIHYKGSTWFAVAASTQIYEYTVGRRDQGTVLKDCEDGVLSKNPIAQGSVDSAVSIASKEFYLYIAAGRSYEELRSTLTDLRRSPGEHYEISTKYWELLTESLPKEKLVRQSIAVLIGHIGANGEIPASMDTDILKFNLDTYAYIWPRDAVHVATALDAMGFWSFTRRFYQKLFNEMLTSEGYLFQKYNADSTFGSTWHPWTANTRQSRNIQEDETALAIYGLWYHFIKSKDFFVLRDLYENMERAAEFLASFIDEKLRLPLMSYDLWEERLGVHTYTVASVYAGLLSASDIARRLGVWNKEEKWKAIAKSIRDSFVNSMVSKDGYFLRSVRIDNGKIIDVDNVVDSATLAAGLLGLVKMDDPRFITTVNTIKDRLWVSSSGGLARYENDYYQRVEGDYSKIPGNPWIITTMWLSQVYAARGDKDSAVSLLRWVEGVASPTGLLPEQVSPFNSAPLSVMPLAWSHAEYLKAVAAINGESFLPPSA